MLVCVNDRLQTYGLKPDANPFEMLGGAPAVHVIAEAFYDAMGEHEPALAKLHSCDSSGRVTDGTRQRFELFLIEWLGGPAAYSEAHGHPRLRMRHAHVPVDLAMRDAWIRCMTHALDAAFVTGSVREFLDKRFYDVATFLLNRP
jgi:hemoglobin